MDRFYFASVVGDGSLDTPFQTAVSRHISRPDSWHDIDMRTVGNSATGEMLTWVTDESPAEHAAILADTDIDYIPFENSVGDTLNLTDPISSMTVTNRQTAVALMEARHIPTDGINLTMTVRQVIRRIVKRMLLRQVLRQHDFSEQLDVVFSTLPAARRNAIRQRLQGLGFALTGLNNSMTIRQALIHLREHNSRWLRGWFEE